MTRPMTIVLALVCLASRAQSPSDGTRTAPVAAIRAHVEQINRAWKSDDGAAIMASLLSDTFTASIPHPGKPGQWLTLNKSQFCAMFQRALEQNRPKSHVHHVTRVTAFGSVCHEIGNSLHVGADGTRREDEILNVWKEEEGLWRLVFSTHTSMLRDALDAKDSQ